jgi:predicted nucleic acid-binding protein
MSETGLPYSTDYVVDASAAIKLFIDDELSERAHALFALLTGNPPMTLYVPDLFFIECANVLWKYVRWGGLSLETAQADLADLARLGLDVTSTAGLMVDALALAQRHAISAYDACYAALAIRLDAPLVTADEKLVSTLQTSLRQPGIIWLGEFQH